MVWYLILRAGHPPRRIIWLRKAVLAMATALCQIKARPLRCGQCNGSSLTSDEGRVASHGREAPKGRQNVAQGDAKRALGHRRPTPRAPEGGDRSASAQVINILDILCMPVPDVAGTRWISGMFGKWTDSCCAMPTLIRLGRYLPDRSADCHPPQTR